MKKDFRRKILNEALEMADHNMLCYSETCLMNKAKAGHLKKWEEAKRKSEELREWITELDDDAPIIASLINISISCERKLEDIADTSFVENKYEAIALALSRIEEIRDLLTTLFNTERSLVDQMTRPDHKPDDYLCIYDTAKEIAEGAIKIAATAKRVLTEVFNPPIDPEVDKL